MGFGGLLLGCVFFVFIIRSERRKIMKELIIIVLSIVFVLGAMSDRAAAEAQKKKVNLNAENIIKATEVFKRNQELFSNKELLQKYQNLVKSLNTKKK